MEKVFVKDGWTMTKGTKPSQEQLQATRETLSKVTRGFGFVRHLPPEAGAHYAGKDVSLGAADTPIFWYRPQDAKKYRVIYADLSVRESDTSPSVPNVQPVHAQPKQGK